MKLASYNVENLFTRAKALNLDTWSAGRAVLEQYSEINAIFENATDALFLVDPVTNATELVNERAVDMFEARSADSLTITFALDAAARWHDGQPVVAADLIAGLAAVR